MPPKVKFGKPKNKYRGIIFDIEQRQVRFPDGSEKTFEYCVRPDSVTILPFDEKGRLLLINEYRHGYRRNTWFLPAGRIDRGESPRAAAQREMREETGYRARVLKPVYKKSPSNTLIWDIYVFAACGLEWAPQKGDEDFPIKVVPTPLARAVKMALSGEIENEFIAYNIIRFDYMLKHGQFRW